MINQEVNIDIDVNDNGTVQQASQDFDQLTQSIEATSEATDDFSKAQTKTADASKKAKLEVDGVFKGSKALVSGFKAAIGAMSLFGTQSEELNNTLLKVQGVMSLSKGLVGFKKFLPEVQNLAKGFKSTLTKSVQGFSKASKIALASTGIGTLIVAVGLLIEYWDDLADSAEGLEETQKALNDAQETYNKSVAETTKQVNEVGLAFDLAKDGVISKEEALHQYNETLGDSLGVANSIEEAEANYVSKTEAYIQATAKRALANALLEKAAQAQADAITAQNEKQLSSTENIVLSGQKLMGKLVDDVTGGYFKQEQAANNLEKNLDKTRAAKIKKDKEALSVNLKNEAEALIKSANELEKANGIKSKSNKSFEDKQKADKEKAVQTEKQNNDALLKLAQDLARQRELIDKDEYEKRRILAERQFQDLVKGLDKETQAYKDALYLRNAEIDKINQEQHNKQVEEQVALQEYLAQVDAENLEAFNKQVEEEVALQEYLAQVDEENKQAEIQREQAVQDVKDRLFNEAQGLANALIGLAGQQSKVGKALALAQIGADTAKALSSALANSQSPTPDNVLTGGLAGIAKYIALAGTILTNSKRAYDIIKAPAPTGGAKGGVPSSPGVPQLNAPRLGGVINSDNELTQMRKVYVVESDITSTQAKVSNTQKVSLVE